MSGIKITTAIDQSGVVIDANNYNKDQLHLPFICPDKNCNAILVHVNAYKRESYSRSQYIPAFFRLEKGFIHTNQCKYKTNGNTTINSKYSQSDVIDALNRGETLFRIHVMNSDETNNLHLKSSEFQLNPPSDTTDRVYLIKGRKATYIKTMSSLLYIYKFGLLNKQQQASIKLLAGGQILPWKDYFYSTSYLPVLYSKLQKNKLIQAAIIVKVIDSTMHRGFRYLICSSIYKDNDYRVITAIKLSKNMAKYNIRTNRIYMILGNLSEPLINDRIIKKHKGHEIRTLISNPSQIIEY
ncbi:hypothetical protein [Photorhabdus luminescens]|uniref:Uncharacterized protein n=1 Tax=Photorhabdus luminescens subsp. mexicana TaxID=2100167 RepID=A0A4V6P859_PHOLU|nr:hypothetical protein [Photorhabdus luminescens]TDB47905.1 hypothetical protein C5468_17610 [Photorhabdus luminescens subsp. mexicana]